MQKKSLTFLLLIILLLPTVGSYISFNLRQKAIKKELKRKIKHGVPSSELISIVLTSEITRSKSFSWHNSHEFKLNGKMYDIIKKAKKGEQIVYKVVCDDEESKLFAQLESDLKDAFSNDPVQKSNGFKFYSFLKQIYFIDYELISFFNINFIEIKEYSKPNVKTYTNEFLKQTSPPPEFSVIS
jgi:hypothetical protein